MDTVFTVATFLLIVIAVAPLLLLALYALASHFDLPIADRILDGSVRLLKLQWFTGGIVSLVAGVGVAALGGWMVLRGNTATQSFMGSLLSAFGLWRAWRGWLLLRRDSREGGET